MKNHIKQIDLIKTKQRKMKTATNFTKNITYLKV